ncbi:MAG: TAXI family TRAP transporter solute-binding subunit, partial [Pseudomonadota bacterium]
MEQSVGDARGRGLPPMDRSLWAKLAALIAFCAPIVGAAPAAAQSYGQLVREANSNTVTIVAGAPGESSLKLAHDLAVALDGAEGLRIVPLVGRGHRNNIYDLLFLRGVDMAVVRADVLDHVAASGDFADNLRERIRFVAPLFDQEVHLLAPDSIRAIGELDGKTVNVGPPGQLALAARRVLEAAGLSVEERAVDHALALEQLIDGEIDAMFMVGAKPIPLLSQIHSVNGLHFLRVPALEGAAYATATLTQDDYPNLASPAGVETVSVQSLLAAYDWAEDTARFEKNALFTRALFDRLPTLRGPARHPKWTETTLTGAIEGWRRFGPAQLRVDRLAGGAAAAPEAAPANAPDLEAQFERQLED